MYKLVLSLAFFCPLLAQQNASGQEMGPIDLSCPNCNVIFLNIDLLRADFGGHPFPYNTHTPNINKFFKESISFTDVMASSGVTAISNTATLTGMDGHFTYSLLKNSFEDAPIPVMPDRYLKMYMSTPTIAENLHTYGYRTFSLNHGWYAGKQMLLNRGIDNYWGTGEIDSMDDVPGAVIAQTTKYLLDISKDKKKFFLLMRSEDLRGLPYRYPLNRPRIIDSRISYKDIKQFFTEVRYQIEESGKIREGYSSTQLAGWMSSAQTAEYQSLAKRIYSAQLSFVDEQLGKLFVALAESSLIENSIIVLYSNHGDGLYDNNVPNHGVSYQSCVSVPLFIKHPKVKKNIAISSTVALIDLVPTVYQMLSLPQAASMDGTSVVSLISDKRSSDAFYYGVDKNSQYIRHKNMKLITWGDRSKELYNLSVDPSEKNNIASEYPDLVSELDAKLSERDMRGLSKALDLFDSFHLDRVPQ